MLVASAKPHFVPAELDLTRATAGPSSAFQECRSQVRTHKVMQVKPFQPTWLRCCSCPSR